MTSLEGAKNISSAGTSTLDVGTSLSVREQLTEFVIQNPSAQPSVQSMSDMRETPAERSSGNPTLTQPTHETTTPTVSVMEFEALKLKVQHLEAENLVLQVELVEVKSTMDQRLGHLEAKLLTYQLFREDYSTEGERAVEKARGKRVLTGVSEELIDSALQGLSSHRHEEYIPKFV